MSQTFGPLYADSYDPLYHDKNYGAECDLIAEILRRYSTAGVSKVLDMGSGTGNHAFLLSSRGYQVVGVERSESMLRIAESKLTRLHEPSSLRFRQGDIRTIELDDQFDAALMMFAVLGYQLENSDALSAFRTARRHLRTDGLFIFDFWYGPAVLFERPSQRVKIIPADGRKILRAASSELDVLRHLCRVHYHLWSFEGTSLKAETEETHLMRYFFPLELQLFLECAGFTVIRFGAFPEFDKEPDFTSWNVLGVARAV